VSIARSELIVNLAKPKIVGKKADIKLEMRNRFSEPVESARATVFLMDENGKMVGQLSHWVIGGTDNKPGLPPGAKGTFHFVVTTDKSVNSTNLQAKILFNRVVLEGGKTVDTNGAVQVTSSTNAPKH
jgi:hypothetical protein